MSPSHCHTRHILVECHHHIRFLIHQDLKNICTDTGFQLHKYPNAFNLVEINSDPVSLLKFMLLTRWTAGIIRIFYRHVLVTPSFIKIWLISKPSLFI